LSDFVDSHLPAEASAQAGRVPMGSSAKDNIDVLVKSRTMQICHFDHREKSSVFNALPPKDFSLRSK
jgi:hypothetical protein